MKIYELFLASIPAAFFILYAFWCKSQYAKKTSTADVLVKYPLPSFRRLVLLLLAVVFGLLAAGLYTKHASYRPDWLFVLIAMGPAMSVIIYRFLWVLKRYRREAQK